MLRFRKTKRALWVQATLTRRLPWNPRGSWLMLMAILFCMMLRASSLMARRSLDMNRGAAMIAHRAIWVRDCSMLRPKSPTISCYGGTMTQLNNQRKQKVNKNTKQLFKLTMSGSFHLPGPAAGPRMSWLSKNQSMIFRTLAQESWMSP